MREVKESDNQMTYKEMISTLESFEKDFLTVQFF